MIATVVKLGAWGAGGLLVGIALATWVGGLRPEGVGLLLVVSVAAAVVVGGIVQHHAGRGGE